MIRKLIPALALCALLPALAACNTAGATIGSSVGSAAGAAIGSQVSETTLSKAQTYAKVACSVLPAADSLRAIYAASNGALATASELARVACGALTPAAYTADAPVADQPAPKRRKRGETVQGTAVVNGRAVPVTGTVTGAPPAK